MAVKLERPYAKVTFFSEQGFPHAGVLIEPDAISPVQEWIHYKPIFPKQPEGPGHIDRTNCNALIGKFVQFKVDSLLVRSAKQQCVNRYSNTKYKVGIHDCVTMAADFARFCRLNVVARTMEWTPDRFINDLKGRNSSAVLQSSA